MPIIDKKEGKVRLSLVQPMSKVRIADKNGNHIKRPTKEGKNVKDYYVEWMITNAEIRELIECYLDKKDHEALKQKLAIINTFLKDSSFAIRKASKKKLPKTFMNFEVYEYKEKFYSFERKLDSSVRIRLTFKMGDFTLAAHMFVLLPFKKEVIALLNNNGVVRQGEILGSGACAIWKPNKQEIFSVIEGLAHASEKHKSDLIHLLLP